MFTLKSLRILPGCEHTKCLHEGEYVLEHKLAEDFFAKNVAVTAIVGQNGAGKSSLLDMLFRMMNNLGYCLYSQVIRNASDPISYVRGLRADLTYHQNGEDGCLMCRDRVVALRCGELKCRFAVAFPKEERPLKDEADFAGFEDYTNPDFSTMRKVAKKVWYLIGTNYSLQAYIAQDYERELTLERGMNSDTNTPSSSIWLNNLFHKNDGYMCPIVLNPYRNEGTIDMGNEEHLTTQRMEAILIEEDAEHPFLQDYRYERVEYSFQPRAIQYGFRNRDKVRLYHSKEEVDSHNETAQKDDLWTYREDGDLEDFERAATNQNYYAYQILAALRCGVKPGMTKVQLALREYVVYKVLGIAEKYPSFSHFTNKFGTACLFERMPTPAQKFTIQDAKTLARRAKDNKSHIGLKLNQALHFISSTRKLTKQQWERLEKTFTYEEYARIIDVKPKGMKLLERMRHLPPSIFHPEIYVKKDGENERTLQSLSSGERQYYYMMSTIAYHMLNLSTIVPNGRRVRYGNICLVMDEIEICFHPDYQRTFLKKFLALIDSMELNRRFRIHVLLTTHSPFLLSDIPKVNILSLEKGDSKELKMHDTFCANVYDLLQSPFFMRQFIGSFAAEKLDELVEDVNNSTISSEDDYRRLWLRVEQIGDDYIRNRLHRQLAERYSPMEQLRNRERELTEQLEKVKTLIREQNA